MDRPCLLLTFVHIFAYLGKRTMTRSTPMMVQYEGNGVWRATHAGVIARADALYEPGETYRIELADDHASDKSRRHFFAVVREYWRQLPEDLQTEFQSEDELRGFALIKGGFAEHVDITMGDESLAQRLADLFIRIRRRLFSSYAIVVPRGTTVRVYVPKSQSRRSMKREEFQASKNAVFGVLEDITKISLASLAPHAEEPDPSDVQRNAPDISERPSPTRKKPESAREPLPAQADTPPPTSSGGSTVTGAGPLHEADGTGSPEQRTEVGGGRAPIPRTPEDYTRYLATWLGFVKSANRIKLKYAADQVDIWPHLKPRLTEAEEQDFDRQVAEAMRKVAA